jgi:hypothetical protein
MQEHNLTSSVHSQGEFKLDLALSLAQMMRKMRAGGSSRGATPERHQEDSVLADVSGAAAFNGHVPIKTAFRLQCDVCKGAQTTLKCQKSGFTSAIPHLVGTAWHCTWQKGLRAFPTECPSARDGMRGSQAIFGIFGVHVGRAGRGCMMETALLMIVM